MALKLVSQMAPKPCLETMIFEKAGRPKRPKKGEKL
jgi:hypothetical protein